MPPSCLFASLAVLDQELIDSLRWRTSDPHDAWRYLGALGISALVVVGLWFGRRTWRRLVRWWTFERRTAPGASSSRRAPAGAAARSPARHFPSPSPASPAHERHPLVDAIPAEDRARAVVRLIQGQEPDEVAGELGVTTALLRTWLERFLMAGKEALRDPHPPARS